MEAAGHITSAPDGRDRRSRLVRLTDSGRALWTDEALPRILGYYRQALDGFSVNDATHAVHYLLKLLDNMKAIDALGKRDGSAGDDGEET